MVKRTKNTIYEIWNEDVADSAFFQSASGKRPTKQDIIDICLSEKWSFGFEGPISDYIKAYIHVSKLQKFYTDK